MRPAATWILMLLFLEWGRDLTVQGVIYQLLTSPPPTTRTFLPLICQATIRLPPPWTSGNLLSVLSAMLRVASGRPSWVADGGS